MCFPSPKFHSNLQPPTSLPPPPPPTKRASAPEQARTLNGEATKRKRGTKRLTVSRRPTLGMQSSGQTGLQMPS